MELSAEVTTEVERRLHHGGWFYDGDDPKYWLLAIGVSIGVAVVMCFEARHEAGKGRVGKFSSLLTSAGFTKDVDPAVQDKLKRWINGPRNIFDVWTGGVLMSHAKASPDQLAKVFETLALLCALLLTVGVTYYTASTDEVLHLHGVLCCVGNCALLLGTLLSTFYAVNLGTLASQAHTELFVGLMGEILLRGPLFMFVIGLVCLYAEMVLWFKMTIDAGSACTYCLTSCLTLAPLFFHCMHKMGWASKVVREEVEAQARKAELPSLEGLQRSFREYLESKGSNCLALDRDEFLESLHTTAVRATSVQLALAGQLFDAHVQAEILAIMSNEDAATWGPATKGVTASDHCRSNEECRRPKILAMKMEATKGVTASDHCWSNEDAAEMGSSVSPVVGPM